MMIDDDRLTEILNNVELDAPDERLKERKDELRDIIDDIVISEIRDENKDKNKQWRDMTYEEKKSFVQSTIEAIYIEKIKGTNQQNYKIKITGIKFKTNRINNFFELVNKGIIDLYCKKGNNIWSMAVIDSKKELDDYLIRLRKRYNIKEIRIPIRGDEYKSKNKNQQLDDIIEEVINNNKCFKTLKISRRNELLKNKF
jgi:hypothetical protein